MESRLMSSELFNEISWLIETTKSRVAQKVNSSLVLMYWQIGIKVNAVILSDKRAEYGTQIIKQLAAQLCQQYGRGFDERSLFRMVRFARQFPDKEIMATLSPLLSWSHFIELISFEDPLKRQFYTEMCRIEH